MNNIQSIKDASLAAVVKTYSTPLYVYDTHVIEKCYMTLKESLGNVPHIYYSLKANPAVAIAHVLQKLGAGVEVCSGAELELAIMAGFSPDKIIFVGPAKKTAELARAIQLRIRAIVCESEEEFLLINELAKTGSVVANVALRINPAFAVRNASLRMGGVPSQFGMDEEKIFEKRDFFMNKKHVHVIGIQVFSATRILNEDILLENTKNILALFKHLSATWKVNFSFLDIGGGFGVPYFRDEKPIHFFKLRHQLEPLLKTFKEKNPDVDLIVESGRYLVAESGVFVSRIVSIRESRGVRFLITDGGMNCHLTAAGYGSLVKRNFPIRLLGDRSSFEEYRYHITGPLCTPTDLIGRDVLLPEAKIGDCVVIESSGAYGPTASPVYFLGHGYPAEVLLQNGEALLIRQRDHFQDFLHRQYFQHSPHLHILPLPA